MAGTSPKLEITSSRRATNGRVLGLFSPKDLQRSEGLTNQVDGTEPVPEKNSLEGERE